MNPYQQYQSNSVLTATPQELTLMLYNGAIKFCNLAEEAMVMGDIQKSNENILKAQKIITELRINLDPQYAVSADMEQMYEYIYHLLIKANITKNPEVVKEATHFIREFRDLWKTVIKTSKLA